jgi:hypothetical protein
MFIATFYYSLSELLFDSDSFPFFHFDQEIFLSFPILSSKMTVFPLIGLVILFQNNLPILMGPSPVQWLIEDFPRLAVYWDFPFTHFRSGPSPFRYQGFPLFETRWVRDFPCQCFLHYMIRVFPCIICQLIEDFPCLARYWDFPFTLSQSGSSPFNIRAFPFTIHAGPGISPVSGFTIFDQGLPLHRSDQGLPLHLYLRDQGFPLYSFRSRYLSIGTKWPGISPALT